MLPAYNDKRIYSLYFVVFLIIGLFFLMNVLLAMVYENYKKRIEKKAELKTNKRVGYISTIFQMFDKNQKEFLDLGEAKRFFELVLDFNYKTKEGRAKLRKIMTIVDTEGELRVRKENLIEYFSLPNFLDVDEMEEINKV
jgi:two pore calcium channel protein